MKEAIDNKVFVIPGRIFSEKNTHFRLSVAADEGKLKRGIEILNGIARQMK